MHHAVSMTKMGLIISEGWSVKLKICIHLFAPLTSKSKKSINIIIKIKIIKKNNDILLTFLLFRSAKKNNKTIETIKKTECLLIEKYSSIENESIKPVIPSDKINSKLILSIEAHQLIKYFIILSHFA